MAENVHERLDSWKAIAEYLDHDPTTVMRWAKERGLPVYVVPGEAHRHRAVYAYKGEIDAWLRRLADHGAAALQNERHNRVAHPEEAHAEEVSERAAPSCWGVDRHRRDAWLTPRGRRGRASSRWGASRRPYRAPFLAITTPRYSPHALGRLFGRGYRDRCRGCRLAEGATIGAKGLEV